MNSHSCASPPRSQPFVMCAENWSNDAVTPVPRSRHSPKSKSARRPLSSRHGFRQDVRSQPTIIGGAENAHVLFLAHRRELVLQPSRHSNEVRHRCRRTSLPGEIGNHMARVQVASVQTLHCRYVRGEDDLPPADLIFIDEAHHVAREPTSTVIDLYPEAKLIGLDCDAMSAGRPRAR